MRFTPTTRREFVRRTVVGGVGLAAGLRAAAWGATALASPYTAAVAITKGDDRADNAFRALQMFKQQIATAIGNKRIIIKPNFVWSQTPLACTSATWVEGVLEFLKSIGKTHIAMAESSATGGTMAGFDLNGYYTLANKYSVQLMDLNQEGSSPAQIWQTATEPAPSKTIRIAKLYLNPNNFIISCAPMKTHNTAVVTMSMKNISMSAPVIDPGKPWSQGGWRSDKAWMHGSTNSAPGDFQVLNDNVYRMARVFGIHPDLAVIDGYQGMEHNGPVSGTAVTTPQKLGIVSLDWVAADRVGLELMGANSYRLLNTLPYPACLNYCGQVGMGEWDLSKIQVLGEPIQGNIYNYLTNDNFNSQLGLRTSPRE